MDNMAMPDHASPTPQLPVDRGTNVFQGRFGLRAVWGIALFLGLFVAVYFALNVTTRLAEGKTAFPKHTAAQQNAKPPANSSSANVNPRPTILGDGGGFVALLIVCAILARVERRHFGAFGMGKYRLFDFVPGAFWGLALLSGLVETLRLSHVLVFDGRVLHGPAMYVFAAKWLLAFLFVGFMEEYLTRGYIQYTLTRGFYTLAERLSPANARALAFWSAAIVMSCIFGAGHLGNDGESAIGITAAALAGLVFTYALWRTGSLWWSIGFHMAWDWAQSFLYGVPDSGFLSGGRLFSTHPVGNPLLSGGTAGPEGSVLVLPTLLLVVAVIRFTTRPGIQPALEPLPRSSELTPMRDVAVA